MSGPWIALAGFVLFGLGVAVSANTSMGGTRSDYDDGSGCMIYAALALIAVGIVATVLEIFS